MNQIALGYLEIALTKTDPKAEAGALIGRSLAMLEDSSRLIDNVRKIQQAVGRDLRLHPVDVDQILCEVSAEYSVVTNRDVYVHYSPVKGRMVIANQLLKDVFSNIVGNAIKHSAGPLDVTIGVNSLTENGKNCYEITVEDNGPGISDELKGAVFTRMKRGITKATGNGLGLYLVKTLVEGFRGRVRVEDRVSGESGKGCRFIVTLPSAGSGEDNI
jgi:signal transduction histidine kinase